MKNNTKSFIQEQKLKDLCAVPSRREFDDRLANINSINNQINQLLSYVKIKPTKNYDAPSAHFKQGYQDYCKRIRQLQNIQKQFEVGDEQRTLQNIQKLKIQKENSICVHYKRNFNPLRQADDLLTHTKYNYPKIPRGNIIVSDSDPISKPSENSTPKFLGGQFIDSRRSRSPLKIQKPDSKYIKKYNTKQKNDQIMNNKPKLLGNTQINLTSSSPQYGEHYIEELQLNKQIKHQKQSSYPAKPKTNYLLTLTQRINQQKQFDEDIIQSNFNLGTEQLGFQNQQIDSQKSDKDKQREKQRKKIEQRESKQFDKEEQNQKHHIKFVQIQFEYPEQRFPIDVHAEQFSTPYRPDFQIKVYPCNLDKETIKSYIADRLAQVVKIDNEFIEFQKMFTENIFYQKFTMKEKINQLALSLANRGFAIPVQKIQQVIGFQVSNQPAFFSFQVRNKFKNFSIFIEEFVNKYLQAEYQWEKKILKMLTRNQIQQTFFKVSKLDLEKKGYLKLQDLTCFINLHASHSPCFKNKSVKNLFNRFCRDQPFRDKLSYEGFLQKISTMK